MERVGGFPTRKKVANRGIDGRISFETREGLKAMVLSAKGGKVRPTDVRDLRGVLEREEEAEQAGFISLEEPTKAMRDEVRASRRTGTDRGRSVDQPGEGLRAPAPA